jgi:hypothetical protein
VLLNKRPLSSIWQSKRLLIVRLEVRVLLGSHVPNEPLSIPVERFLASLRFENRGKLDDLRIEVKTSTIKLNK